MTYVLTSIILSVALTSLLRTVAYRAGWVAKPRADRWHHKPVALLGGAAIFATYLALFLWIQPRETGFWLITASATVMFAVGLADDFIHLPEKICFCMHMPLR